MWKWLHQQDNSTVVYEDEEWSKFMIKSVDIHIKNKVTLSSH